MKALSSLDLKKIVYELQPWAGSRVNKVYQIDDEILFELYKKERVVLSVKAGDRINLTDYKKEKPKIPPGFCMLLRKRVEGGRLTGIRQEGFDRVVVLEFEKGEKLYLVAELFSKGNLVLCDSEMKIVQPLRVEFWKGRQVKPRVKYKFPPECVDVARIGRDVFEKLLVDEDKKIVVVLATKFGLGGEYAEEVCHRACVDKDMKANEVDLKKVWDEVQFVLKHVEKSKPFRLEGGGVSAFELKGKKGEVLDSDFNSAVDEFYSKGEFEEDEGVEESLKKALIEKRMETLGEVQKAIDEFEREAEEAQRIGEWLKVNSLEVQKLLSEIEKYRKEGLSLEAAAKKLGMDIRKDSGKVILEVPD